MSLYLAMGGPHSGEKYQVRQKKATKIENQPKKHPAIFRGTFAHTMVFHMSKKFPNIAD